MNNKMDFSTRNPQQHTNQLRQQQHATNRQRPAQAQMRRSLQHQTQSHQQKQQYNWQQLQDMQQWLKQKSTLLLQQPSPFGSGLRNDVVQHAHFPSSVRLLTTRADTPGLSQQRVAKRVFGAVAETDGHHVRSSWLH